jgi:hypothetical protein
LYVVHLTSPEEVSLVAREIDLLIEAVEKNLVAVEKETNVVWSREDVCGARAAGRFRHEDRVSPAAPGRDAVSGIFPGCLQQGGAGGYSRYALAAQTEHFLLFSDAGGGLA